jgi:cell division protein FtsB
MSEVAKTEEQEQPLMQRWWSQYKANRRRIGTVAAAVFAVLLAWHVVSGRNGLTSWQQKRADDKALAKEIEQLTAENARISQHVDRLRSDPGAIEHEARLRLKLVRPNELIYTVADAPKGTQAPAK